MFSKYPCGVCGTRQKGKLASAYWAWFNADNERYACKQRLCVDCVSEGFSQLLRSASEASPHVCMCPACGTDASADLDPIYLTLYVPGREQLTFDLTTCAVCAAMIRIRAQEGSERLENRQLQSSIVSPTKAWDDLGLAPSAPS